jgi:hypothetical protein
MRKALGIFLLSLVLTSCAVPLRVPQVNLNREGEGKAILWNLRIERWGDLRFSGLLAVRQQGEELYYAMLDPTGIKLLEVAIDSADDYKILHAKGVLQDSSLGGFLAEVLVRIYRQQPANLPCAGFWLHRLCEEETDSLMRRYSEIGPLTIWSIAMQKEPEGRGKTITYRQPWLGVKIVLTPTSSGS